MKRQCQGFCRTYQKENEFRVGKMCCIFISFHFLFNQSLQLQISTFKLYIVARNGHIDAIGNAYSTANIYILV